MLWLCRWQRWWTQQIVKDTKLSATKWHVWWWIGAKVHPKVISILLPNSNGTVAKVAVVVVIRLVVAVVGIIITHRISSIATASAVPAETAAVGEEQKVCACVSIDIILIIAKSLIIPPNQRNWITYLITISCEIDLFERSKRTVGGVLNTAKAYYYYLPCDIVIEKRDAHTYSEGLLIFIEALLSLCLDHYYMRPKHRTQTYTSSYSRRGLIIARANRDLIMALHIHSILWFIAASLAWWHTTSSSRQYHRLAGRPGFS